MRLDVTTPAAAGFQWQLGDLPLGYDHKYIYSHMGFNLKITDMQAACGLAQLDKLEGFVAARKQNFSFLKDRLADLEEQLILPESTPGSDPSWFGFPVTLRTNTGLDRREVLRFLDERRIGTRLLFAGNITKQPYMAGRNYRVASDLKNTETVMNNTFWVGVHPSLTTEMMEYVVQSLDDVLTSSKCRLTA